ncbi:hypothetical protein CFOL_v3_00575 [Cephalotus follicularis]|uniref:Uncharacterized protein n=1 Tax=Cephalotus follicularis TaxID=3775 RepID=A0A1Q3AMR0_CEPFO|nr:hypothetical protein CFOL_v3_00575 [Cephalotus follicularis]
MDEMMELFKQVQINLPLLDAIRQVPAYAKFLKDLCTTKRKLKTHIPRTVHLTEQVSAVLSNKLPPKLKDPGARLISCKIGNLLIEISLLDLGASVNILPSLVYDHFGFGELKPTEVTLQLTDRSLKIPKGFIEDVLVKVDELYFPVDFLVLDMETPAIGKPHSIILGRPFLATANACINCRSGAMDISFGNKKLRLNIFNAALGPQGEEACFAIDMIDRTYPRSFIDDDCEADSYTVEINALLDSPLIHSTPDRIDTQWLENEAELAWLENKLNDPNSSSEWDHQSHYTHKIATPDQTYFDKNFESHFIKFLEEVEELEATQKEVLSWLDDGLIDSILDNQWDDHSHFTHKPSTPSHPHTTLEKNFFFTKDQKGWRVCILNAHMFHWLVGHTFSSFLNCFYWWNSCWDGSYIVKKNFSHFVDALICYGSIHGFYWWKYFWDAIYIVQTVLLRGIFEFVRTSFKDTFNVPGLRLKPYVDGITDGQIIESVGLIDPVYTSL